MSAHLSLNWPFSNQLSQILGILKEEQQARTVLEENRESSLKYLHGNLPFFFPFIITEPTNRLERVARTLRRQARNSDAGSVNRYHQVVKEYGNTCGDGRG